jgi:carbonic anhydrase
MNPDEAWESLAAGNRRYVAGEQGHPDQTPERRRELAGGQRPFAAILGCSDSRVPPELIFDQGLGDLFVVRVAGNIVDAATLGSLEYAVHHLGVSLIVVLGHSSCGAVQATLMGGRPEGSIAALVAALQPAVEVARQQPGPLLDNAVRANVTLVAAQLQAAEPILAPAVASGALRVEAGVYSLTSGAVELL